MRTVWRRRQPKGDVRRSSATTSRWTACSTTTQDIVTSRAIGKTELDHLLYGARPWHTEITRSALSTHIGSKTGMTVPRLMSPMHCRSASRSCLGACLCVTIRLQRYRNECWQQPVSKHRSRWALRHSSSRHCHCTRACTHGDAFGQGPSLHT
jgi:hypothetical protein